MIGRRRAVLAGAALVPLLVAGGCSSNASPSPAPDRRAHPPRASAAARWVPVRPPEGLALLEAPAEVLTPPGSSGVVSPPMPARVEKVWVQAGQRVTRGEPVVSVVMPQLATAAGSYTAARTRSEAWRARLDQLAKLRAEGLTRISEIAEVETRLAEARADQQHATAILRSAGIDPGDASELAARGGGTVLRSPVEGTVTEVDAMPGELRDAGGRPFARVAGEGPPRIQARVAHALPEGARFEFVEPSGAAVEVRLVSRAPVVDPRDGTAPAWFEPARPTRLPRGMTGRVRVLLDQRADVFAVPAAAVGIDAGRPFVIVRAGEGHKRVPVDVLATSGADALVQGPLGPSDEVAAEAKPAPGGAAEGP